jgi:N-acetylglucosamine-6-phosphate deacetylase
MSRAQAIVADRVYDGDLVHDDAAVLVEADRIVGVLPRRSVAAGSAIQHLPAGAWLAPGFIDVQVNGGGDVLFNAEPSASALARIAAAHRRFGTTALLPTLITDRTETMRAARDAVAAAMRDQPAILGIHFEGPFLSPARGGVHERSLIRKPETAETEIVRGLRGGVTLVTLAPEEVPAGFIAALVRDGVRVALGHSRADYEQTRRAIAEGLTGFTHLFNAMPPLESRAPGPIAAALESPGCWYGLIADGVHVHPAMLRLALRGSGQPMLVSDAMPPTGGTLRSFALYGEDIALRENRLVRRDGTLAGAMLDMASAVRNAVRLLDLTLPQALRLATRAPAEFLGLGDRLGRLAAGYRADLVAFDPATLQVHATWVAGEKEDTRGCA